MGRIRGTKGVHAKETHGSLTNCVVCVDLVPNVSELSKPTKRLVGAGLVEYPFTTESG